MMVFRFGPVPNILQITRTGLIDCSKYSNSIMGTAAQQQQILCITFFQANVPACFIISDATLSCAEFIS